MRKTSPHITENVPSIGSDTQMLDISWPQKFGTIEGPKEISRSATHKRRPIVQHVNNQSLRRLFAFEECERLRTERHARWEIRNFPRLGNNGNAPACKHISLPTHRKQEKWCNIHYSKENVPFCLTWPSSVQRNIHNCVCHWSLSITDLIIVCCTLEGNHEITPGYDSQWIKAQHSAWLLAVLYPVAKSSAQRWAQCCSGERKAQYATSWQHPRLFCSCFEDGLSPNVAGSA